MRTAALLIFDKCLSPRQTTANNCKTAFSLHMSSRSLATTTTYSYFWGRKINLSGISLAKRSRSEPNSMYVDMSRGDNVQGILGAIGPFWAKWGLGRFPRSQSFLCVVIQRTFRQLRNGRFSPNFVTKRSSVSRRGIREKTFSKIFTLGVI